MRLYFDNCLLQLEHIMREAKHMNIEDDFMEGVQHCTSLIAFLIGEMGVEAIKVTDTSISHDIACMQYDLMVEKEEQTILLGDSNGFT